MFRTSDRIHRCGTKDMHDLVDMGLLRHDMVVERMHEVHDKLVIIS